MSTKLYIGNLSFSTTEASLGDFFAQIGSVASVKLITDRDTGRSRGFGFVEMSSSEEADKAISELNGKELDGRAISVSEARPQAPRSGGGGGFGGGGGGGYGGGGGGGYGGGGGRGGGGGGFGGGGGRGGKGGGGGRGGRGGGDRY
jgi:RNA recognition motif-containing protein